MIAALMVLVLAVVVLGWVLAGIAFIASLVSIVPRMADRAGESPERDVPRRSKWRAGDDQFLRDLGIKP